jgi:Fic family protein
VKKPLHLASYVMWRLNWIHPFTDGNGRTSRAVSYLVLCIRLRALLPGKLTIPEQIEQDKTPYYRALEAAERCVERRKDRPYEDETTAWGHVGQTASRSL